MHKLLLHLPREQLEALRAIARTEGNSIAAVIRRAIAQMVAQQETRR